jgi:hypothetical protein
VHEHLVRHPPHELLRCKLPIISTAHQKNRENFRHSTNFTAAPNKQQRTRIHLPTRPLTMTTRCSGNPPPCATSSSASALHTSSPPPRAGSFSTSGRFPFASFTAPAAAVTGDGGGRKQLIQLPLLLPPLSDDGAARSARRSLATARGHLEDCAPGAGVAARPIEAAIIRRGVEA